MNGRASVCLSVRLTHQSTAAAVAGGFAAERPDSDRQLHAGAGAAYHSCRRAQQQRRRSTALDSKYTSLFA